MSTPASCTCSPSTPHPGSVDMTALSMGVTHYIGTSHRETVPALHRAPDWRHEFKNPRPWPRGWEGIDPLAREVLIDDLLAWHAEALRIDLETRIDAALKELALPHPDKPVTDWLNAGGAWSTRAARARRALGAEK